MSEGFCLSDKKKVSLSLVSGKQSYWIKEEDVKEFIRRLKEKIDTQESKELTAMQFTPVIGRKIVLDLINQLAGDKLI